jgi:hypothetical protein
MSYIAFGGEKKIADLVTRIYGKLKAADARRAAAALLEANPQLARIDLIGPGRPIAVPSIRAFGQRPEVDTSAPLAQTVEQLRASAAVFLERLGDRDKEEKRSIEQTRALMESDDLRSIIEGNATVGDLVERIAKSTDQREADLERRAAFVRELRRADKQLAELSRSLG